MAEIIEQTEVAKIKPEDVNVSVEGFYHRDMVVRLPEGIQAREIHEHAATVWQKVQQAPTKALRKYDRVTMFTHDESHVITATVADATHTSVHLAAIKINSFRNVNDSPLWFDEKFAVSWNGAGYVAVRKADGVIMSNTFENAGACKAYILVNLYPKKVGVQ